MGPSRLIVRVGMNHWGYGLLAEFVLGLGSVALFGAHECACVRVSHHDAICCRLSESHDLPGRYVPREALVVFLPVSGSLSFHLL